MQPMWFSGKHRPPVSFNIKLMVGSLNFVLLCSSFWKNLINCYHFTTLWLIGNWKDNGENLEGLQPDVPPDFHYQSSFQFLVNRKAVKG